jgi:hypothetical protein
MSSTPQGHPSLLLGGGKQGSEVTHRFRSPEEQRKHSNAAVCGFHTAPSSLMPQEEYPPREVVASKCQKKSTSGSHLDAREVEAVAVALKSSKGPPPGLRLAFEREGGGGSGKRVETPERSTSGSR